MEHIEIPPPLSDEDLIRRAQRRMIPGAGLVAGTALLHLLLPVLLLLGTGVFGIVTATSGQGLTQGNVLGYVVAVVLALLMLLPPLVVAVPTAMAWRLQSEAWILGAGIVAIVVTLVYAGMMLCVLGGIGCLVAPIGMGLGVTGGVLLIVASQHPQVLAGVEAKRHWRLDP